MPQDPRQSPPPRQPFTAPIQVHPPQYVPQGLDFRQLDSYAEQAFQRGRTLYGQKRLDEALAAFDKAIALKPDYAEAHNNRGIVLASLGRSADALAAFAKAVALKPDYAEAHNNRGILLEEAKRFAEALGSFDQALALKPDNARAHNNRGIVLDALGRSGDALAAFARAVALMPDYAEAYYNRATLLHRLKRFDDALADFGKAIALQPHYGEAYNNRGILLQELGRPDEALSDYDRAIALMPGSAEAYCNKAYCLLQIGRFVDGWRLHEWRKKTAAPVGNRSLPQPLWLGEQDISGKTLYVHCEQGFGDTLQFFRYAKLARARGARVLMSVQKPLYRLLKQIDMEILSDGEAPAAFDYHCPMMSLPLAFGTTVQTIPAQSRYISADPHLVGSWRARLPLQTRTRVGIAWRGSSKHKNDLNRSIELPALAPLFAADAQFVSLQKELADGEAARLREVDQIVLCGDELADFADTAAVIDLLDLVIAVDTSVAHLAGAMGKPVWILLPFNADWRWLLDRDDSPWYPSARLFRQSDAHSWGDVIARVKGKLGDFVRSHR